MLNKKIIYFLKTVEEGSFSAAARALYLSQPAMSQQVKSLEQELGFALFDRSQYRPVLTAAGRKYYLTVKQMQTEYATLVKSLREQAYPLIKIAFTGLAENKNIIKLTNDFKQLHPADNFEYYRGSFNEGIKQLLASEVDVAFGLESTFRDLHHLSYRILRTYQMCVIVPENDSLAQRVTVTPQDLRDQQFVVLSKQYGIGMYNDFMTNYRKDGLLLKNIVKQVDSFDDLLSLVAVGEGIAIVSRDVVKIKNVKAIPLIHSHHHNKYVIAFNQKCSSTTQRFVDYVSDQFKQTP